MEGFRRLAVRHPWTVGLVVFLLLTYIGVSVTQRGIASVLGTHRPAVLSLEGQAPTGFRLLFFGRELELRTLSKTWESIAEKFRPSAGPSPTTH